MEVRSHRECPCTSFPYHIQGFVWSAVARCASGVVLTGVSRGWRGLVLSRRVDDLPSRGTRPGVGEPLWTVTAPLFI